MGRSSVPLFGLGAVLFPLALFLAKLRHTIRSTMHSFVVAIYLLLSSSIFAIPGRFLREPRVLSVCTRNPGFVMSNTKPPFCTPQTIHFGPEHEMSQTLLTRRVLTPYRRTLQEFITVDCGAAMGWYTLFWAKLGFDVLAFEPGTTAFLLDAIKLNPESQGLPYIMLVSVESISQRGTAHIREIGTFRSISQSAPFFLPERRSP